MNNINNINEIEKTLSQRPDHVVIYTMQFPEYFKLNRKNIYISYPGQIDKDITTIELLQSMFPNKKLKTIDVSNQSIITIPIETPNNYVSDIFEILEYENKYNSRTKTHEFINKILLNYNLHNDDILIILRTGTYGYALNTFEMNNNNLLSSSYIIKIIENEITPKKIFPYIETNKIKNPEYLKYLTNTKIMNNYTITEYLRYYKKIGLQNENISIVLNTDDTYTIINEFSKLTEQSHLVIIGYNYTDDDTISSNIKIIKSQNNTILDNINLDVQKIIFYISRARDGNILNQLIINLHVSNGYNSFRNNLMTQIIKNNHIINPIIINRNNFILNDNIYAKLYNFGFNSQISYINGMTGMATITNNIN